MRLAAPAKTKNRGPGLLYILVALVVVGVAGAKFFGFAPSGGDAPKSDKRPPQQSAPESGEREGKVLPSPADMSEVLVYHTHTSENYAPKEPTATKGPGDVVAVGKSFAQALNAEGIQAVHVMTVHDLPKWDQAFDRARASVRKELARRDGMRALVDIHRDAVPEGHKPGYATIEVNGDKTARILLVVGAKGNDLAKENLAYAKLLQERLEGLVPGITRGVRVVQKETTGDLDPHVVTAYVGDYRDSSVEEAERAAVWLAKALAQILKETG